MFCKEERDVGDGKGRVEECLKAKFTLKQIRNQACKNVSISLFRVSCSIKYYFLKFRIIHAILSDYQI